METIKLDVDTPAGEQARWLLEHALSGDLTVEDVAARVDPGAFRLWEMLPPYTPEGYVALQRWAANALGSVRVEEIVDARSSSPFEVEVTFRLDDGSTWTHTLRVDEEVPHRIVQLRTAVADDEQSEDAGPDRAVVHCVDHFIVPLADPRPALDLLTGELGLPLAVPWGELEDGTGNGVVELGNVQLELLNLGTPPPQTPARVGAIAFEPPPIGDALVAELDRRGLPHMPPAPAGYWTNIFFGGFLGDEAFVFSCRFHHPAIRDRAATRAALEAADGGELGVTGVVELVIGTTGWQESVERWQALLDPIASVEPGYWRIGDGPAVRIVEGAENGVREVVLGVRSVERAATRVRELGVGTTEPAGDGALLDLPPLNGLVIRLTEDTGPT